VAGRGDVVAHAAAGGDVEHDLDQVEPGDELGDAVLDLQARVDLEEVELVARRVDEELDGADRAVGDRPGQRAGRRGQPRPQVGGEVGGRRLLDHLLVAPLHGAVAVAEHLHLAPAVADHLHLDVPGDGQEALDEQRARPEAGRARAGHPRPGVGQLVGAVDPGHPDAAPTGGGLEQHGVADGLGLGGGRLEVGQHTGAGQQRNAGRPGESPGAVLVAERLDLRRRRADERQARGLDRPGEVRRLGQEAVAGMHRLGPRGQRRRHDAVGGEVGVGDPAGAERHGLVGQPDVGRRPVGLGVHGHRADAEPAQRRGDAAGDLSPVGDEDAREMWAHGALSRPPGG
jgi:hypothetical protein